jgi:enoyl-CoA hydratase/carnithine racemase
MPDEVVLTERRGAVGIIFLNRPAALNAWTGRMQQLCFSALAAMESDPAIRVIVLTGKGRAFCAGADMGMLNSAAGGGSAKDKSAAGDDEDASAFRPNQQDVLYPTTVLKPIIAAVNGPVAGIGLSLALACDMRFAADDAKFVGAFSRRGLVAEYGSSWTLPKLAGTGNALMLLMSSDPIKGDEALRMGVVQRCFPSAELLQRTVEFAQHLADTCSPTSMAAMKLQVWGDQRKSLREAANDASDMMAHSLGSGNADFKEGVLSFLQKRPVRFAPLDKDNPVVVRASELFLSDKARL